MPTKTRVLIDNACYHVIVRGNQRQNVFDWEVDFKRYIDTLCKYKRRFKVKIYAYCLMSNHVHLLVDPPDKYLLKELMHSVNLSYSRWYNYKYSKCGHLWQGRYKSLVVQKDSYVINCMSYIELNPVRANICQRAEDYPWSSYNARTFGGKDKVIDELIL